MKGAEIVRGRSDSGDCTVQAIISFLRLMYVLATSAQGIEWAFAKLQYGEIHSHYNVPEYKNDSGYPATWPPSGLSLGLGPILSGHNSGSTTNR